MNGYISVLDWFHNSKYEFKYTVQAISGASQKWAY